MDTVRARIIDELVQVGLWLDQTATVASRHSIVAAHRTLQTKGMLFGSRNAKRDPRDVPAWLTDFRAEQRLDAIHIGVRSSTSEVMLVTGCLPADLPDDVRSDFATCITMMPAWLSGPLGRSLSDGDLRVAVLDAAAMAALPRWLALTLADARWHHAGSGVLLCCDRCILATFGAQDGLDVGPHYDFGPLQVPGPVADPKKRVLAEAIAFYEAVAGALFMRAGDVAAEVLRTALMDDGGRIIDRAWDRHSRTSGHWKNSVAHWIATQMTGGIGPGEYPRCFADSVLRHLAGGCRCTKPEALAHAIVYALTEDGYSCTRHRVQGALEIAAACYMTSDETVRSAVTHPEGHA
ncbi:hypothetical protein [Roseomonas genomospecies 6]|uniref:Uncharacterized protein n=1 Tax=Roseomonas genomospecies 6 TaxID=214106 RepID=A0A9W7NJ86_9PROT|nr:hypothetical protein [Roseomonas genomospecies 6]KAA0680355.1 hypothetical protein DS843_13660 [Roseomonas genomospecies 6]